jgi:uncharacterized protein
MRGQRWWVVLAIAAFLLLGGLSFALDVYFDLLWFQELGKTVVFTTILYAKSTLATVTLVSAFFFLYLNLWLANEGPGLIQIGIPTPTGQITAYTFKPAMVRRLVGVLSLVVALVFALRETDNWETIWKWLHAVKFNQADPIFGRDIGFYFFTLPVLNEAVHVALSLSLLAVVGVVVLYYFKGTLGLQKGSRLGRGSRRHVSFLAAIIFLLLAVNFYLDRFQVLYSDYGPMYGATYADIHARLPLLYVMIACSIVAGALFAANAFATSNRRAVVGILVFGAGVVLLNAYPAVFQRFVVAPNELDRETPQIQHNIQATLRAYDLDTVEDRSLTGDKALTAQDIQNNAATIQSIRLWDHEPLLDAFRQIQEIRTYYDFVTVDNDRYVIGGQKQQVMLSPRELNSTSLPERNWINERISYTHGYGLTLGPVNRATTEGLPALLTQDIPPRSTVPVLNITRPEIYFGELTRGYVVVKTSEKEFDYPQGEANSYTYYQGTGGVPIESFFRKVLFAAYLKDTNILLSPLLKPESRFLYFRDLRTRLSRVAPFLKLDQDPYMVILGGRLVWIQDAYTTADEYPYATPTDGVGNYIRNSVKMVLDAYNGTVDLYVSDPDDPLIQVYQNIFPGLFRPLSEMPPELRAHIRYPEDIFKIQTSMYAVYHMDRPQVFYNKEDLWEIPALSSSGGDVPMLPYYTIMRLPQGNQEEFILMLPFTPNRKDNLSAWMVARSDEANYGKLAVYRFPKQKLVYGPKQIVARINQDAEISRQISLWDQRGSQVIQGNLLVIPIEEALLYVRPLYIRAESGKIPELKRVIVAYENRIAMEPTLEASLARIFQGEISEAATPAAAPPAPEIAPGRGGNASASLSRQAREAYDRAVQAQREGDWARYGAELKRLGAILDEMSKSP